MHLMMRLQHRNLPNLGNNYLRRFHRIIAEKIEFKVIFSTDLGPTPQMPRIPRRVITLRGSEAIFDNSPALRVICVSKKSQVLGQKLKNTA